MDDVIAALHGFRVFRRVANISRDDFQIRVRRQTGRAEEHQIVNNDCVPGLEKFRHEDAPFVSSATGHQDSFHQSGE